MDPNDNMRIAALKIRALPARNVDSPLLGYIDTNGIVQNSPAGVLAAQAIRGQPQLIGRLPIDDVANHTVREVRLYGADLKRKGVQTIIAYDGEVYAVPKAARRMFGIDAHGRLRTGFNFLMSSLSGRFSPRQLSEAIADHLDQTA